MGTCWVEEYAATVTLTTDFSANTLSGRIGCQGDIAIRFELPDVTVRHPDRTITHSEGFSGG